MKGRAMRRPNILLITTDQQRYDGLGINGNPVLRTPHLDALAASGVNFSRCYATCPVCIPARRTLISGLHPRTHGLTRYQEAVDFHPPHTLPGELGKAGYQTQLIGKLHLHPQRKRFGFDHMILSESGNYRPDSSIQKENDYTDWLAEQGVRTISNAHGVDGVSRVARPFHLEECFHHSSWVAREGQRFLRKGRDPDSPWFLHLSFVAPHPPLTPPAVYWDRYVHRADLSPTIGRWAPSGDDARRGVHPNAKAGPFPPDEIHDAIAGYYGLIHHVDDCVNHVLSAFFEYGAERTSEPTWILFSSDHGEMLGDHHLFSKSLAYEPSAHVPLFITGRHVDTPVGTCDALVGWEDLMPTILDLAGAPVPDGLDGRSLLPVMRGEQPAVRDALFGVCGDMVYAVRDRWKYIRYLSTCEEQLFDLVNDPRECRDLSGEANLLAPLREAMDAHLAAHDTIPAAAAVPTPCDNQPPRALFH